MSKILNVGTLDVRNITEELANSITLIQNIGVLVESKESQILLKNCKKANIGITIKAPKDEKIKVVSLNGKLELDKEYLEGFVGPTIFSVNGKLIIDKDIDKNLLDEKILNISLNGKMICPRKLAGIILSKGKVNGVIDKYNSDYDYIDGRTKLTNTFLKGLKPKSKLSFSKLIIVEDFDKELFEEKIDSIEVLGKLVLKEEYEQFISNNIDDYYQVDKLLLPSEAKETIYVEDNMVIDDNQIKKYDHAALYVEGDVQINLKDNVVFSDHITYLGCDKVICNEKTYEIIKDYLREDMKVEIIKGSLWVNKGSSTLPEDIKEEVTIKNMGFLAIGEELEIENFEKNVAEIKNYGFIEVPEKLLDVVKSKIKTNYGKIGIKGQRKKDSEEDMDDVLYANLGELTL